MLEDEKCLPSSQNHNRMNDISQKTSGNVDIRRGTILDKKFSSAVAWNIGSKVRLYIYIYILYYFSLSI